MTESFYAEKITQSDYRGSDRTADKAPQYIDLTLDDLQIKDDSVKAQLRQKIEEEAQKIAQTLLPEDLQESAMNGDVLQKIYVRLGLA